MKKNDRNHFWQNWVENGIKYANCNSHSSLNYTIYAAHVQLKKTLKRKNPEAKIKFEYLTAYHNLYKEKKNGAKISQHKL